MTTLLPPHPSAGATTPQHEGLQRVLASRVPGRPLPGPAYTDSGLYDADLRLLWHRQWVFAGSVAEVPEPGDYVTVELGPVSVIVVRDDDGQVRALRNVCRHRGARLVSGSGSIGNLVCGYHRWTYGTDGRLLHAPSLDPQQDRSCLGLRQVAVVEAGGLVFINLAARPDDPTDPRIVDAVDVATTVTPYLAPHRLDRSKVAAQVDLVEQGNWKLVMENNRECYHCDGAHPELTRTFFATWGLREDQVPPRLQASHDRMLAAQADLSARCAVRRLPMQLVEDLVDRPLGHRIAREPLDGVGESFSLDGARLVQRLLGDLDDPRLGRVTMHAQPNMWAHALADHAVTFAVFPVGVDQTLVRTTWLVDAHAVEGVDYDLDQLTEVWRETNAQDAALVESTQRGVADPAYEPGPYTEAESNVDWFVSWYVARMRDELREELGR